MESAAFFPVHYSTIDFQMLFLQLIEILFSVSNSQTRSKPSRCLPDKRLSFFLLLLKHLATPFFLLQSHLVVSAFAYLLLQQVHFAHWVDIDDINSEPDQLQVPLANPLIQKLFVLFTPLLYCLFL